MFCSFHRVQLIVIYPVTRHTTVMFHKQALQIVKEAKPKYFSRLTQDIGFGVAC